MFDFDCRDDLRTETSCWPTSKEKAWFQFSVYLRIWQQKSNVDQGTVVRLRWFWFSLLLFYRIQTYCIFISMWSVVHMDFSGKHGWCWLFVSKRAEISCGPHASFWYPFRQPLFLAICQKGTYDQCHVASIGWIQGTSNDLSVDVWGVEICFQNFQVSHDLTKHIDGDQSMHAPAPGATLVILWRFTIAASNCEGPKCQSSKSLSALFFAIFLSFMQCKLDGMQP